MNKQKAAKGFAPTGAPFPRLFSTEKKAFAEGNFSQGFFSTEKKAFAEGNFSQDFFQQKKGLLSEAKWHPCSDQPAVAAG